MLLTYKGSRINYALATPEHIDMGIPPKWATLKEIMRHYPYKWVRASNANYFGAVIQGEAKDSGGAMAGGQIVNGRPAVYVRGGRAWYSYDHLDVYEADVAVGAGPMLVVDGVIGDLEQRISRGSFSGLRQTNKAQRCAIGYASDGLLLHAVAESLTLYELAQWFIEKGCVWAMNLDGGSSVGLLEGDSASFNTAKRIPSALVIREVVEEVRPVIMLDAGHGGKDPGAVGHGLKEKDLTLDIAQRTAFYLAEKGVDVLMARDSDETLSIEERIRRCNESNAKAFVMVHINAAKIPLAHGAETWYWHTSRAGADLAKKMLDRVVASTSLRRRIGAPKKSHQGVSGYFKGLRLTKCPAVIIECGFISNKADADYLNAIANRSGLGWAIAQGILEWLGRV